MPMIMMSGKPMEPGIGIIRIACRVLVETHKVVAVSTLAVMDR